MKYTELSIKQKRVMRYFIEATEELIKKEGFAGLTIRKIANAAGYNSATLYNYFEDLADLMLFSSISFLKAYVHELNRRIKPGMSALDRYKTIYETFDKYSFQNPEVFYNLFFGKYSHKLPAVIKQYYELFPEELEGHSPAIRGMLLEGNMYLRDEPVVRDLVEEGCIRAENADIIAHIIPRLQQTFLHEVNLYGDSVDADALHNEFMQMLDYLIETAK